MYRQNVIVWCWDSVRIDILRCSYQGTAIRDRIQERLMGQQTSGGHLLENGDEEDEYDSDDYYDEEEYYEEEKSWKCFFVHIVRFWFFFLAVIPCGI